MSASSGPLASTKGESTSSKASKPAYDHLDINKLYKGKSTEPVSKPVTQKHGMQALGKAIPARRPGQTSSLKGDTTGSPNDISNSTASVTQTSSAALASTNRGLQSHGNQPPSGWASTVPHPPGPPSPHNVPSAPLTGHVHDKNWSGSQDMVGQYPSQRFAQEFPSLASGAADAPKATAANASGPSSSAQAQSVSKSQDNQYGPGPILRPQTEGSWIQGGGRGMSRPPGPTPPLNGPSREFQGPDRANLGGPTPPPMSLGQGGPAPPPLGAFSMPFRGMMPPPYMFPNGPPAPGPGFYPPGTRFAMPIPPRAPPPPVNADGPREQSRSRGPPPQHPSRPSSVFTSKPIIKDEDLKRMDEIGGIDGGWASTQDDVDYNKTISFSDEDESKENKKSVKISETRSEGTSDRDRDRDRDRDDIRGMERRPTKILERQPSTAERDTNRDLKDQQRFDNVPPKDHGPSRTGPYVNENEEEWKSQQQQPNMAYPPQQQQRRVNLGYEDKVRDRDHRDPRDPRDPRDRRNEDRGGNRRPNERREEDNWRSSNTNRPFDEDGRGNKGPQVRNREEPRAEPRDFASKGHPNNLPPRLQRQQFQSGPQNAGGGPPAGVQQQSNTRQTPSPGSSGGKERDFQGGRDWDREKGHPDRRRIETEQSRKRDQNRRYVEYDPRYHRNDRVPEKDLKNSRFGPDQRGKEIEDSKATGGSGSNLSRSSEAPKSGGGDISSLESKDPTKKLQDDIKSAAKPKMSWADEMDDDEIHHAPQHENRHMKMDPSMKSMSALSKPDYYTRPVEERQKRVILHKHQRKVADLQPQKPEPPAEVKQLSEPAKTDVEPVERVKSVSAWGERENRDKISKTEKEQTPPQRDAGKYSGNVSDKEGRKSQEKDNTLRSGSSQQHSSPSAPSNHQSQANPAKTIGSGSVSNNVDSSTSGIQDIGYKSAMITKSTSGRSISAADVDSTGSRNEQRNSISDASDREHFDRESVSSQDNRSKPPRHLGQHTGDSSKLKQRPTEREKREKTLSERDGSDVGSEHGGIRGDKSHRGNRIRERGSYPVHPRGNRERRENWDRPRSRGSRGRGTSHYYDKPSSRPRTDSERDHHDHEEITNEKTIEPKPESIKDEKKEKLESVQPTNASQSGNKKEPVGDEDQRPKKDKEMENSAKKAGKNASAGKRSNANARGGGKLEGYGPPSDQKPFSSSNKDEESDRKEKSDSSGSGTTSTKDGGIPSLMAVDISPPSISQLKKGHFHTRSTVPPRMQGQRGESFPERERERYRGSTKRGSKGDAGPVPNSSLSQKNKNADAEDSEEWTDNDSDAESKKSGTASNKSKKDSSSSKAPGAEKPRHINQSQNLNRWHGSSPAMNAVTTTATTATTNLPVTSLITLGTLCQLNAGSTAASTNATSSTTTNPKTSSSSCSKHQDSANNNANLSRSRMGNDKIIKRANGSIGRASRGDNNDPFAHNNKTGNINASSTSANDTAANRSTGDSRSHLVNSDNNEHNTVDDSGSGGEKKKKPTKQAADKGFSSNAAAAVKPARTGEKGSSSKITRVKNVPYDARAAAHANLPPRFANKRDSTSGPAPPSGNGKSSEGSNVPTKGVEPASPPATNAWEKPIAPVFRPEQNSQNLNTSNTSLDKDPGDTKLSSATTVATSAPSTNTASSVLDGTNPPTHTMIFENRKLKNNYSDSGPNKGAVSKLPEAKKDTAVPTSGIEYGKNLGSLGFAKGPGEESPELDFGPIPFDDPSSVPQSQPSLSMMSTHHTSSPKPLIQQSSRHSFDHQSSPCSPCAADLTEKIQSAKKLWETPSMPSVPEQASVCGPEETSFHGAFSSESFKGSDSGSRDFGSSSLPQSAVGYSGGSSPSMASMGNSESRSSPNANNIRPPSKGPQSQQPPVTKAQAQHAGITSAFGSYGMETQPHMGANNYGAIPVVGPNKIMYTASKVVSLDAFGSQFPQYPNAPATGCAPAPYGQGGNVYIKTLDPKYQQMQPFQQHSGQNRNPAGQGTNHNRVSPGPITSSSAGNTAPGQHINSRSNTMMPKNPQQNRNAAHTCMAQPVHQQGFYTHNPMTQQQVPKGAFGPANGGYSEGGLTTAYQPQILIPVDVNAAMFNISGNYESSDLRSGPPPTGPPPPGTPPVQGSSNYYFGTNNNACVFPPSSSQNVGMQFATTSIKMPGFNSMGASDSASNMGSQRIRSSEQPFIQPGLESLSQNAMKSQHEYIMNQPRWNSANDFQVNQGNYWSPPGPIQRPINNYPSGGPVGMSMVPSATPYMTQNISAPQGHVGVKPNNSSNESMANPGTPPKSPHPRKNI